MSRIFILSEYLGNPSMRKSFFSDLFMALSNSEQVMATGTMVPLVMWFSISSPYSDPGLFRSSRNRSPSKCVIIQNVTKTCHISHDNVMCIRYFWGNSENIAIGETCFCLCFLNSSSLIELQVVLHDLNKINLKVFA